jgi:RNA polymerase sigma factor (sigma-70 family)
MDTVIRHLRRAVLRQDGAGWTDGQLLASFIDQKDEAAFEALVRRHGRMVFGVCRRVVGNHHDAEDAFQATFLVLARKAPSVRPRERLANWLHGVALRTAMKAKAMTAKRRGREKQVTEMPEPEAAQQGQWRDLQPLLDQELNGLPENYRLPLLLCDLEGKTIKDAAHQLGWPQGTLAGRLARGRKLLAKRLASRGVALSAGSLAAVVSQNAVSAAVPTSLMSTTVKAAAVIAAGQAAFAGVVSAKVATLMEGVLKTMFMTKLKSLMPVTMAMLAIMVGVGGVGLLGYGRAVGQQEEGNKAEVVAPNKAVAKSDKDQLLGKWLLLSCKCNGEDRKEQPWSKDALLVIEEADGKLVCKTVFKDKLKVIETFGEEMEKLLVGEGMPLAKAIEVFGEKMEKETQGILKLDARTKPKTLDVRSVLPGNGTNLGIYQLDGDTLTWCMSKAMTPEVAETSKDRPTDFSTTSGDGRTLMVYKRQKEAGKTDLDRLQGVWSASWCERGGERYKADIIVFMVDGKRACWQDKDSEVQGGLYPDPTSKPKSFDFATSRGTMEGIYSLNGDALELCYDAATESKRPRGFLTEKGSRQVHLGFKRILGPEAFSFRLADGTKAFPPMIERETTPPPPPRVGPTPKDNNKYDFGLTVPAAQEFAPRRSRRIAATVNGEAILAEEVYAAAYLSLPDTHKLTALDRSPRITAAWRKTLDRVIEREAIVQEAFMALNVRAGNANVLKKLQEIAANEFGRQWVETVKRSTGLKDDEQLRAFLRAQGTSLDAVRRQWERDFIADQYLRSRVLRGRDPGATPSDCEDARQERARIITQLKQRAVIEYAGAGKEDIQD